MSVTVKVREAAMPTCTQCPTIPPAAVRKCDTPAIMAHKVELLSTLLDLV